MQASGCHVSQTHKQHYSQLSVPWSVQPVSALSSERGRLHRRLSVCCISLLNNMVISSIDVVRLPVTSLALSPGLSNNVPSSRVIVAGSPCLISAMSLSVREVLNRGLCQGTACCDSPSVISEGSFELGVHAKALRFLGMHSSHNYLFYGNPGKRRVLIFSHADPTPSNG